MPCERARRRPRSGEGCERGVPTPDEIAKLLDPAIWSDYRHFALNLLAFAVMNRVVLETQPKTIVFSGDTRDIPIAKYTIEWNFNQA